MHIGHTKDDWDNEDLAMRHLGAGILKERAGNLPEALDEYRMANVLDPRLEEAQMKLDALQKKLGL